jgi:hypothetical protein
MGMEIVHKISSLPYYIYISLFVLEDFTTDNDTVHVYNMVKETYILSTFWNAENIVAFPYSWCHFSW